MDTAEELWITLLRIAALEQGLDISNVPSCVLEAYALRDLTVQQALELLC